MKQVLVCILCLNISLHAFGQRNYNGPYSGKFLDRVAFPIGGMGAGMFCLEGTGAVSHMSVRHHMDFFNEPGMFAAIHLKGVKNGSKVLEIKCPDGCEEGITEVTETDRENLQHCYEELRAGKFLTPNLGKCPKCGKNMILNNVYAAKYDEKGYLENWTTYQTWLQNTLNHKLVLLEIGEGNRFPSIIKNPFQRIALFQQKADLYCIDGEQNPIAWLLSLC